MRVENIKGAVWTVNEAEFCKRRPQKLGIMQFKFQNAASAAAAVAVSAAAAAAAAASISVSTGHSKKKHLGQMASPQQQPALKPPPPPGSFYYKRFVGLLGSFWLCAARAAFETRFDYFFFSCGLCLFSTSSSSLASTLLRSFSNFLTFFDHF
uniref:Forkhead box protein P1 n=1 Tax=Culex pipiens TaxID=7175 RepID=A0A8D8PH44_CULPI